MKYKRLTTQDEDGNWKVWEDDYAHPFEALQVSIDRLAEYEDDEESGKIIRLPCKVGDTVYTIEGDNIEEHEVLGLLLQDEVFLKIFRKRDFVCKMWGGRSVFYTREEAEKRLKELQNG